MKQPQGYRSTAFPTHVCRLNKALYGLRQAPRAWFSLFSGFLVQQGFTNSKADSSLFTLKTTHGLTLVLVYVEDILITGSDTQYITQLITTLHTRFVMKDLGTLSYFLGILGETKYKRRRTYLRTVRIKNKLSGHKYLLSEKNLFTEPP